MTSQRVPDPAIHQIQSPDLWQKALDSLDREVRDSLDLTRSSKHDVLRKTLETAKQKKQLCLNKRWKFESHGKQVVLRDVLQRIINWLDHFKAIGDNAMQYDPGHASLPWAGVRLLLQFAISESRFFGSTVENLEGIASLITRYAKLEELHMQRNKSAFLELEQSFTALYAEILTFLAKAKKYFETSSAVRIMNSLSVLDEDKQMKAIKAQEVKVTGILGLSDTTLLNQLQGLVEPITRIADQAVFYKKVHEEARYCEMLDWLSPVPFHLHHHRPSKKRLPGSGQWLLSHPEYQQWKASGKSAIFLLHGPAGSGKTFLASTVVDSLNHNVSSPASPASCIYFYCAKAVSEPARSEPSEILGSILRQISTDSARKAIHDVVANQYKHYELEAEVDGFTRRLDAPTLLRLILEILATKPATIVIDALDELPRPDRYKLVNTLKTLCGDTGSTVKLFLTSRDDGQILALLPNCSKVRIEADTNQDDMREFVRHHVDFAARSCSLLNGDITPQLKADIIQTLLYTARERFLFVDLLVDRLCQENYDEDGEDGVRRAMIRFSKETIDSLYLEHYQKILTADTKTRSAVISTFALLLYQREPLTPDALLSAVHQADVNQQTQISLSNLLKLSKGMVIFDSGMNMLRFVHASAQEFLERQPDLDAPQGNKALASSCISMCTYGSPVGLDYGIRPTKYFYHYSVLYWAEHLRLANTADGISDISSLLKELVFDDEELNLSFITWTKTAAAFSEALPNHHVLRRTLSAVSSPDSTPLFTGCAFGLADLLTPLTLLGCFDWNQTNNLGYSGLYLACACGHASIVDFLLTYGADVNARGGRYGSPLQVACYEGHAAIVEQLLVQGADPEAQGKYDNALKASIAGDNEDIAMLILNHGFQVTDQHAYDDLVQAATLSGQIRVVQHLQQIYVASYARSRAGQTRAIESAIFKGKLPVLQDLSNSLLPIDCIAIVALGGQDKVVTLLLDKSMDIELEGQFGNPLRSASIMGHETTVRLLLDRGANVNASSEKFGDALQAAAGRGHLSVTKLLLLNGAKTNSRGGFYRCALQAAAHQGHVDVVKALLAAGANVYTEGHFKDAFHAAADGGREQVAQLFLDNGFRYRKVHAPWQYFHSGGLGSNSPLDLLRASSPSRNDRERSWHPELTVSATPSPKLMPEIIKYLGGSVEQSYLGANATGFADLANHQRDQRNNALRNAASQGHHDMVKVILGGWHTLGAKSLSSEFDDALLKAASHGHIEVVMLLAGHQRATLSSLERALKETKSHGYPLIVNALRERISQCQYEIQSAPADATIFSHNTSNAGHSFGDENAVDADDHGTLAARIPKRTRQVRIPEWALEPRIPKILIASCSPDTQSHVNILSAACIGGDLAVVDQTLDNLARICVPSEIASVQSKALLQASLRATSNVTQILIKTFSFEHCILLQVFHICCNSGQYKPVLCLLRQASGCQFEESEISAGAVFAAGNGQLEVVRLLTTQLLSSSILQDTLDRSLNIAARNGHAEVGNLLLQEGANPNTVVEEPQPLDNGGASSDRSYRAPSESKRTCMQAALAGYDATDRLHQSPNHWRSASISTREKTILLLLEHGVDVNKPYNSSRSLMHFAVERCSVKVAESMIEAHVSALVTHTYDATNSEAPIPKGPATDGESAHELFLVPSQDSALELLFKAAACREIGAADVIILLLQRLGRLLDINAAATSALNAALRFFDGLENTHQSGHRIGLFGKSESVHDVLKNGPGAPVKILLEFLPSASISNRQYSLLLQMAIAARDRSYIELLLTRGNDINATGHYYGTALQCAARFGDNQVVQMLLHLGADINVLHGEYATALRAAVAGGHAEVVSTLLEHGADVNLRAPRTEYHRLKAAQSILTLCLKFFNFSIFSQLVNASANINVTYERHDHVLIEASGLGDATLIQLLLDHGADMNAVGAKPQNGPYSQSALHIACAKGFEEVAFALLQHGANVELQTMPQTEDYRYLSRCTPAGSMTPLQVAAHSGHASLVRLLIKFGAEIDHSNKHGTALSIASTTNKTEVMEELLRKGASLGLSLPNMNALAAACQSGHREAVSLILDELAASEVEESACTDAMIYAAAHRKDEIFQLLVDHVSTVTSTMLTQACAAGLLGSVLKLLDLGVDLNSDDDAGCRAIQVAAHFQRAGILKLLLERGADVHCESEKYGSPLQAILEGYVRHCEESLLGRFSWIRKKQPRPRDEFFAHDLLNKPFPLDLFDPYEGNLPEYERLVQLLLDHEAEVNPSIRTFGTPLHYACYLGSRSIVDSLLAREADANASCGRFDTPLIAALEGDHPSIAELLLRKGADVNYSSPENGSALHYACSEKGLATVQMLLRYGANVNAMTSSHGSPFCAATRGNSRSPGRGPREGEDIADFLLELQDFQLQKQDLLAAIERCSSLSGEEYLEFLLKRYDRIQIQNPSLLAAAKPSMKRTDVLESPLQYDDSHGTTEAMIRAARNQTSLKVVLSHRPIRHISLGTIQHAARTLESREAFRFLLNHDDEMHITEEIVLTVLDFRDSSFKSFRHHPEASENLIESLLKHNQDLRVTPAMLKAARQPDDMQALLKHAPHLRITAEILEAVASKHGQATKLVTMLLAHDKSATVPQAVLSHFETTASANSETEEYLASLLGRSSDLDIPAELLLSITKMRRRVGSPYALTEESVCSVQRLAELLLKYDKRVVFTDSLREAIELSLIGAPGVKTLCYQLEKKD